MVSSTDVDGVDSTGALLVTGSDAAGAEDSAGAVLGVSDVLGVVSTGVVVLSPALPVLPSLPEVPGFPEPLSLLPPELLPEPLGVSADDCPSLGRLSLGSASGSMFSIGVSETAGAVLTVGVVLLEPELPL